MQLQTTAAPGELSAAAGYSIFPNPGTASALTRSLKQPLNQAETEVTDALGRSIYKMQYSQLTSGNYSLELPGKMASGIYSVTITGSNFKRTEKLLIE